MWTNRFPYIASITKMMVMMVLMERNSPMLMNNLWIAVDPFVSFYGYLKNIFDLQYQIVVPRLKG